MRRMAMIAAALLVAGCSLLAPPRIVGTWSGTMSFIFEMDITYSFRADGSFAETIDYNDGEPPTSTSGTWELADDVLTMSANGETVEYTVTWQQDGSVVLTLLGTLPVSIHLYRA